MTLEFEQEAEWNPPFSPEELMRRVIEEALEAESFPYEAELSVLITDNAGIQEINREMRGMDAPTDVLSFPMADYETPGDFSVWEEESFDLFNPDSGEAILGDIVISAEKVQAQAKEFGHSEERELAFLTAHSMYHLFGYDHMEDEDRLLMEEKQRNLLDRLGISR